MEYEDSDGMDYEVNPKECEICEANYAEAAGKCIRCYKESQHSVKEAEAIHKYNYRNKDIFDEIRQSEQAKEAALNRHYKNNAEILENIRINLTRHAKLV